MREERSRDNFHLFLPTMTCTRPSLIDRLPILPVASLLSFLTRSTRKAYTLPDRLFYTHLHLDHITRYKIEPHSKHGASKSTAEKIHQLTAAVLVHAPTSHHIPTLLLTPPCSLQSDDWDKPQIIGYGARRPTQLKGSALNSECPTLPSTLPPASIVFDASSMAQPDTGTLFVPCHG